MEKRPNPFETPSNHHRNPFVASREQQAGNTPALPGEPVGSRRGAAPGKPARGLLLIQARKPVSVRPNCLNLRPFMTPDQRPV